MKSSLFNYGALMGSSIGQSASVTWAEVECVPGSPKICISRTSRNLRAEIESRPFRFHISFQITTYVGGCRQCVKPYCYTRCTSFELNILSEMVHMTKSGKLTSLVARIRCGICEIQGEHYIWKCFSREGEFPKVPCSNLTVCNKIKDGCL